MQRDAAQVCCHVAEGAPILLAAREDAADPDACEWRFHCGAPQHEDAATRVLPLAEVLRRDATATQIVLHPRGSALQRSVADGRWRTEAGPVLFPHRPSRRFPRFDPRYPPRPGEVLDAKDLRLMADVSEWGWHVVLVPGDGGGRAHAFTVGLFRSFDHPEVAVFGLDPEDLEEALRRAGERIRGGQRLEHGDLAEGIVDRSQVSMRRIVARHYPAYLGHAIWYHGGPRFPAVQCVWGDEAGRFPWDRWFAPQLRDAQPLLYEAEPA
jgi:hypothetical protein